jgi:DNA-binding transcriptional MerR regulator
VVDDGEQVPAGWCEVGIVGHLEMGLLTHARSSGRRRYTIDDVYRVAATLRAKRAGLSLDQIEQVIITTDPTSRTASWRRATTPHRRQRRG